MWARTLVLLWASVGSLVGNLWAGAACPSGCPSGYPHGPRQRLSTAWWTTTARQSTVDRNGLSTPAEPAHAGV